MDENYSEFGGNNSLQDLINYMTNYNVTEDKHVHTFVSKEDEKSIDKNYANIKLSEDLFYKGSSKTLHDDPMNRDIEWDEAPESNWNWGAIDTSNKSTIQDRIHVKNPNVTHGHPESGPFTQMNIEVAAGKEIVYIALHMHNNNIQNAMVTKTELRDVDSDFESMCTLDIANTLTIQLFVKQTHE